GADDRRAARPGRIRIDRPPDAGAARDLTRGPFRDPPPEVRAGILQVENVHFLTLSIPGVGDPQRVALQRDPPRVAQARGQDVRVVGGRIDREDLAGDPRSTAGPRVPLPERGDQPAPVPGEPTPM